MLAPQDLHLIEKRRRVLRHLGAATWVLPTIWIGAVLWTLANHPHLNNPMRTVSEIRDLPWWTVQHLAVMAPVAVVTLQLVVLLFIVMGLLMLRRERRLLQLLDAALSESSGR